MACNRAKAKCSSERPCGRCVRMRLECVDFDSGGPSPGPPPRKWEGPPSSEWEAEIVRHIERPIEWKPSALLCGPSCSGKREIVDALMSVNGLEGFAGPIHRCAEMGWDANRIVNLFASLPASWMSLLTGACRAAQIVEHHTAQQDDVRVTSEMLQSLEDLEEIERKTHETCNVAMVRFGFFPQLGKRRSAYLTAPYSRIHLMHREEAMARLLNRETPLCCPEVASSPAPRAMLV